MASDKTSKRELIDTGKDKRFVRRDDEGRFDEVVDVGKSLAQDRRQHAKTEVEPSPGRPRRSETTLRVNQRQGNWIKKRSLHE
jgi:hypothetical protein